MVTSEFLLRVNQRSVSQCKGRLCFLGKKYTFCHGVHSFLVLSSDIPHWVPNVTEVVVCNAERRVLLLPKDPRPC